jgi:membrane-associated phospholipid phosphatase
VWHASAAQGTTDAAGYHGSASDPTAIAAFATKLLGPPPSGAADAADLAQIRAIVPTRTDASNQTALMLASQGTTTVWQPFIDEYVQRVGTSQAQAGVALLAQTKHVAGNVDGIIKSRWNRPRPFVTDPSVLLPGASAGGTSYPSGHSTDAFAIAGVLAHLMPDEATTVESVADQVAFSRMYCGVHYMSDVTAGARLGAMIAQTELSGSRVVIAQPVHMR